MKEALAARKADSEEDAPSEEEVNPYIVFTFAIAGLILDCGTFGARISNPAFFPPRAAVVPFVIL